MIKWNKAICQSGIEVRINSINVQNADCAWWKYDQIAG